MTISFGDLFILGLIFFAGIFWWNALGAKEIALDASRAYCEKMDVQMLDDSVELRGLWFKRDKQDRFCLWRSYYFEFSSLGDQRYKGRIILLGKQVLAIELEPHQVS